MELLFVFVFFMESLFWILSMIDQKTNQQVIIYLSLFLCFDLLALIGTLFTYARAVSAKEQDQKDDLEASELTRSQSGALNRFRNSSSNSPQRIALRSPIGSRPSSRSPSVTGDSSHSTFVSVSRLELKKGTGGGVGSLSSSLHPPNEENESYRISTRVIFEGIEIGVEMLERPSQERPSQDHLPSIDDSTPPHLESSALAELTEEKFPNTPEVSRYLPASSSAEHVHEALVLQPPASPSINPYDPFLTTSQDMRSGSFDSVSGQENPLSIILPSSSSSFIAE